ncbi:hypothetical protein CCP3SC15_2220004 [Gammaproteobacteria bacterium]
MTDNGGVALKEFQHWLIDWADAGGSNLPPLPEITLDITTDDVGPPTSAQPTHLPPAQLYADSQTPHWLRSWSPALREAFLKIGWSIRALRDEPPTRRNKNTQSAIHRAKEERLDALSTPIEQAISDISFPTTDSSQKDWEETPDQSYFTDIEKIY